MIFLIAITRLIFPLFDHFRSSYENEEFYICFYGNVKSSEEHSSSITKDGKEHSSLRKSSQETAHKTQRNFEQFSSFSPKKIFPLNQSTTESAKRISFVTPEFQNMAKKNSKDSDNNQNHDNNDNNNDDSNNNNNNNNNNRYNADNGNYKSNDKSEIKNNDLYRRTIRTDSASNKAKNLTQKINENDGETTDKKNNDCINRKENIEVGKEHKEEIKELELQFLKISLKKRKNIHGLFSISVKKEILYEENSTTDLEPFILEFKNLFGTYVNDDRTEEKEKKEMMCVLPDSRLLWSLTASFKNVPENVSKNDPKNVPCYSGSSRTENDKVTSMLIMFAVIRTSDVTACLPACTYLPA